MGREQHRVRLVLAGTRNFDEDVGSFKVYTRPWAAIHNGRIEVVDDFDVRLDGFDPG